jgi:hypothetical protein
VSSLTKRWILLHEASMERHGAMAHSNEIISMRFPWKGRVSSLTKRWILLHDK